MKEKLNRVILIKTEDGIQILSDKKVEVHVFDFVDLDNGAVFEYPSIIKSGKLTKKIYEELKDDVASYDPYKGE